MASIQSKSRQFVAGRVESARNFQSYISVLSDYLPEFPFKFCHALRRFFLTKYRVTVTASFLAAQIVMIHVNLVCLLERMGGISRHGCVARRRQVKAGKVVRESQPFVRA